MKRILIVAAITFGLLGFSSCDSSDTPDEPKVENDFPSQETFDKIINGNLWERNTPIIGEDEDGNFVPDDFFRLYTGGGTITKLAFLDNKMLIFGRAASYNYVNYYYNVSYDASSGKFGTKYMLKDKNCDIILSQEEDTIYVRSYFTKFELPENYKSHREDWYKDFKPFEGLEGKEIYKIGKFVKNDNPDYKELMRTHYHSNFDPDTIGLY